MSFALTTDQIRTRTKTVTRRLGWQSLKPGTLLQPVVKGQGLKAGERVQKVGGPIRVVSVQRVILGDIRKSDCVREGFPELQPLEFAAMFCRHNGGTVHQAVTRIEFSYVDEHR